ncbi:MAG: peptidase, partial [Caulobacteraceae bacterium]|nr:peptidase [Caulobacteraceae bacterium]
MTLFQIAVLLVFPAAVIFAAAMDLVSMTIPNRISIVLVAAFFILA